MDVKFAFIPQSTKPSVAELAKLLARGAFTVPETLRSYLAFLCRIYTDPAPPLHLIDRLLADLKFSSCVLMDKAMQGEGEETPMEGTTAVASRPAFKKPGRKATKWLVEKAQDSKFVMTPVGKPDKWTADSEIQ